MESIELHQISDDDLKQAYIDRFCIKRGESIRSSHEAVNYIQSQLVDRGDREYFLVIFLNGQNCVLESKVMFEGTLTSAAVYPREVVKASLAVHAAAVILAHNHPSGAITPSAEDQAVTRKLKNALELVDIRTLDHIIIGTGNVDTYSFADHGLL